MDEYTLINFALKMQDQPPNPYGAENTKIDKRIDEMGEIKKKIKQAHKTRLKIHNLCPHKRQTAHWRLPCV